MSALDDIREAMRGHVRLEIVPVFFGGPQPEAVQVYTQRTAPGTASRPRWTKVGPLLFAPDGGTVADTLAMLAAMRAEAVAA